MSMIEDKASPQKWRRTAWLLLGGALLCSWCSLLSGVGGWIMGYDLGKREAKAALLPATGVLVTRVEHDGPADQAGIRRGDMIIGMNGIPVDDVVALQNVLMDYEPGDSVLVTYHHDLGKHATYVELARSPDSDKPYLGIYYTARAEAPADM